MTDTEYIQTFPDGGLKLTEMQNETASGNSSGCTTGTSSALLLSLPALFLHRRRKPRA